MEKGVAVAWFSRQNEFLELQYVLNRRLALQQLAEGICLATIIKRGFKLNMRKAVLVSYTNETLEQFTFMSHLCDLVPALAIVGIRVLDIIIVSNEKDMGSRYGKLARPLQDRKSVV